MQLAVVCMPGLPDCACALHACVFQGTRQPCNVSTHTHTHTNRARARINVLVITHRIDRILYPTHTDTHTTTNPTPPHRMCTCTLHIQVIAVLTTVASELNSAQAEFEYRKQLKLEQSG